MPKFEIKIFREVTLTEEITRTFEASAADEALGLATAVASELYMDTPADPRSPSTTDIAPWQVDYDSARELVRVPLPDGSVLEPNPPLLAVAERMLDYAQSGAAFNYPLGSVQELELAVAAAKGGAA